MTESSDVLDIIRDNSFTTYTCKECGANFTYLGNGSVSKCPYCGDSIDASFNYRDKSLNDFFKLLYKPENTPNDVIEEVYKDACSNTYSSLDVAEKLKIDDVSLVYIPVYHCFSKYTFSFTATTSVRKKRGDKSPDGMFDRKDVTFRGHGDGVTLFYKVAFKEDNKIDNLGITAENFGNSYSLNNPRKESSLLDVLSYSKEFDVPLYFFGGNLLDKNIVAEVDFAEKMDKKFHSCVQDCKPKDGFLYEVKTKNIKIKEKNITPYNIAIWNVAYHIDENKSYMRQDCFSGDKSVSLINDPKIVKMIWLSRIALAVIFALVYLGPNINRLVSDDIGSVLLGCMLPVIVATTFVGLIIKAIMRRIRFYKACKAGVLKKQHGLILDSLIILLPIIIPVVLNAYSVNLSDFLPDFLTKLLHFKN